jgi:hypothetical protein
LTISQKYIPVVAQPAEKSIVVAGIFGWLLNDNLLQYRQLAVDQSRMTGCANRKTIYLSASKFVGM